MIGAPIAVLILEYELESASIHKLWRDGPSENI